MNHASSALARRPGGVLLLLSLLLLSACGGGGTGSDAVPSQPGSGTDVLPSGLGSLVMPNVDSFSPLFVESDGQPMPPLTWVYRVNDGQPLQVATEEGAFELTFPDMMMVTFDPGAGLKFTNLKFRYTGTVQGRSEPVTGLGTVDVIEMIDREDGCPQILGRSSMLQMSDEADEPVFSLGANSQIDYPVPLRWRPDCADLGSFVGSEDGVGVELLEAHMIGSMTSFVNGVLLRTEEFEDVPASPDQWVVTEVLDEFTVQDRVFRDVVAVDLVTLVPDVGRPESPDRNDIRVVRMWFARGVGLIRAEGAFLFWGQPVAVDLVDFPR